MSAYRLTKDAKQDIIDIRRYTLKQWGEAQSKKYLKALRQTIIILSETPTIGMKREDVGKNIFSFPHVSHCIYFILEKKQFVVFGVLHKSMVPLKHLGERKGI